MADKKDPAEVKKETSEIKELTDTEKK